MGLAPDLRLARRQSWRSGPSHTRCSGVLCTSPSAPLAEALAAWNHGYCPACGSWPALAEVVDGHRLPALLVLRGDVGTHSSTRASTATSSGEGFVTAAPEEDRKDRRVELCSACGAYLKTVDVFEVSPFPLVAIADLETMDLDVAAIEHHYARPPLVGFKKGSGLQTPGSQLASPRSLKRLKSTLRLLRGAGRIPARCPCAGCCRARPS